LIFECQESQVAWTTHMHHHTWTYTQVILHLYHILFSWFWWASLWELFLISVG
jgi:hypothetical protein